MITLPTSFRTSLSGVVSEGVAEVEASQKADRHANRGNQQNLCWCHLFPFVRRRRGRVGKRRLAAWQNEPTASTARALWTRVSSRRFPIKLFAFAFRAVFAGFGRRFFRLHSVTLFASPVAVFDAPAFDDLWLWPREVSGRPAEAQVVDQPSEPPERLLLRFAAEKAENLGLVPLVHRRTGAAGKRQQRRAVGDDAATHVRGDYPVRMWLVLRDCAFDYCPSCS